MALHIGVDVGGTKVLAAEVDAAGAVLRTARRSTPGRRVDAVLVEQALSEAVAEVADGRRVDGVGLAAAGFVDAAGERVMFAPHLPWQGEDVRARLADRWGTTVVLDNDANCAALAEGTLGAARGVADFLLITMGTGIGGGLVLGGRVHRGRNGMAGEFGHAQVVPDGQPCECGGAGCWEQYSSGNALVRFARARIGREPTMLEQLCGGDPSTLVGPMVTEAAEQGDLVARQAFASVGDWLGVGLANLVAAFDPELVVVGGGVSAAGDRLLEPARHALVRSLVGAAHREVPPVVRARFGPEAGVVGGAILARQRS
ncbi:ROK family protein [Nocardioides sp. Arc9.136]|uniref:ROK family protein n=1 Tax=Nocardioides sp. Arc9.136 TaxID=2996826 RepID=UPI00266536FD|nr:ROK family protein [Nocardioides sp. Arc9.136]WKN50037.1 ROK family protein [Nocardioides sp. Arc9.136]